MKQEILDIVTGGIAGLPYGAYRRARETLVRAGKAPAAQVAGLKRIAGGQAEKVYRDGKYAGIYLATEDSRYDTLFRERFGEKCTSTGGSTTIGYTAKKASP